MRNEILDRSSWHRCRRWDQALGRDKRNGLKYSNLVSDSQEYSGLSNSPYRISQTAFRDHSFCKATTLLHTVFQMSRIPFAMGQNIQYQNEIAVIISSVFSVGMVSTLLTIPPIPRVNGKGDLLLQRIEGNYVCLLLHVS